MNKKDLLLTEKEKRLIKQLPEDRQSLAEFNILEYKLNKYLKEHNLTELD